VTDSVRIGKYEILKEVGRGGFAVVYEARDPDLDRVVALKVLAPHLTWDPAFAQRFHREARAMAKLRHPHIITIHEVGEDVGQLYIAMEYLPAPTLTELLQVEGAMPLDRALPILEQIAEALDYAHGRGVIHRDIKPSNIKVEETERGAWVTLLDFGLVKAMESSESLTSVGTILGSPEYMAPEQADPDRQSEIGPASDRYALGVVAYKMLSGRVPFPGSTPSTLVAHIQKAPPDPQSICENLLESVAQVLLKALSKAAEERFPTAMALVDALRQARQDALAIEREAEEEKPAKSEPLLVSSPPIGRPPPASASALRKRGARQTRAQAEPSADKSQDLSAGDHGTAERAKVRIPKRPTLTLKWIGLVVISLGLLAILAYGIWYAVTPTEGEVYDEFVPRIREKATQYRAIAELLPPKGSVSSDGCEHVLSPPPVYGKAFHSYSADVERQLNTDIVKESEISDPAASRSDEEFDLFERGDLSSLISWLDGYPRSSEKARAGLDEEFEAALATRYLVVYRTLDYQDAVFSDSQGGVPGHVTLQSFVVDLTTNEVLCQFVTEADGRDPKSVEDEKWAHSDLWSQAGSAFRKDLAEITGGTFYQ
jgi:serine/threonine protein kinase